jgi:hypothetical protein
LPAEDFDGDPRIAYGFVDMGADEFHTHLYYKGEAAPGNNIEIKLVGLPGTAPVGLFLSFFVTEPPWKTKWGDFHLQWPWWLFYMPPMPSNGVLSLPGVLPTLPPAPYDLYLQAIIGSELTNLCIVQVE